MRRIFDFGFLIFDWWKAPGAGDAPHLRDARITYDNVAKPRRRSGRRRETGTLLRSVSVNLAELRRAPGTGGFLVGVGGGVRHD